MRRWFRVAASALVAVGTASGLAGGAAVPAAADPAPAAAGASEATVTLVTGDRARVVTDAGGRASVSLLPRADGTTAPYLLRQFGDDQYVVPRAATRALADGRLDEQLFNVTGLVRQGYDDAHTAKLPLIATYPAMRSLTAMAAPRGATRTRVLAPISGAALAEDKSQATAFWQAFSGDLNSATGIGKLWLDGQVKAQMAESTAQIHAPEAWAAGYDGAGTTIAVLDSGIDPDHPDLVGKVAAEQNFTADPSSYDGNGHGTHTASTAAGTGAASGGTERGVAPGAKLLVGKVLDDWGYGLDSWVIAGMQWAVDQGADVVSMSLGSSGVTSCDDPVGTAAQALTGRALFVIAAGNDGPHKSGASPGCAPDALTVGAVDSTDRTADFSSRGFVPGTHTLKPEIAAPGVGIVAAAAGGRGDDAYRSLSGTSMSTPHVAGAAAILQQRHPDWTPAQLKAGLVSSADGTVPGWVDEVGAGRVDVAAALKATVLGPAAVQAGAFAWPQGTASRSTTPVTYTNTGDQPVTLRLELAAVAGNDDKPAPAGMATLGATTVTVPAHGTASVPLRVDATGSIPLARYGDFGGRILATGSDGTSVSTPFAFYVEPRTVTLTVKVRDRTGAAATYGSTLAVTNLDTALGTVAYLKGDDALTYRVRTGSYMLSAMVSTLDDAPATVSRLNHSFAYLGYPQLTLTKDTTITLDARQAHRVTVSGDRPLEDHSSEIGFGRWWDDRWVQTGGYVGDGTIPEYYAWTSGRATLGGFEFGMYWRLTAPELTMNVAGRNGFDVPTLYGVLTGQGRDRFRGRGGAELVDAGDGTALAGVSGRIALVTLTQWWETTDVARAAKAAGAVGVLFSRPEAGRWQPLNSDVLPVATVEASTAAALRARLTAGPVTLRWNGIPDSPYVYNVGFTEAGPIDRDLRYRVRDRDLATVRDTWYGVGGAPTHYTDWLALTRPWNRVASIPIGLYSPVAAPGERTEYYTAGLGPWLHTAKTDMSSGFVMNDFSSYRAGQHRTENWYRGVLSPIAGRNLADGSVYTTGARTANKLAVNLRWGYWGDSDPNHWSPGGLDVEGTATLRDSTGQVLGQSAEQGVFAVPAAAGDYALTYSVRTDDEAQVGWQRSPATDTTFRFRSQRDDSVASRPLAMIFPRYGVPVDADNTLPARDHQFIALSAVGHAGYPAGAIVKASLAWSYDGGRTWVAAPVSRRHGQWVAEVDHRGASGKSVTLRVDLTDAHGAGVSQTVLSAYTIR